MTAPARPYIDDLIDTMGRLGHRVVLRHDGVDTAAAHLLAAILPVRPRARRARDRAGRPARGLRAEPPGGTGRDHATHILGAASSTCLPAGSRQARADAGRLRPGWWSCSPRPLVCFPRRPRPVAAVGPVSGIPLRLDALAAAQDATPLPSRARTGDLAVVISSGGTTGVPKGSVRDFGAWTASVVVPSPADRRQLANGNLAYLPQLLVDITLLGGGTVVLQDGFDAAARSRPSKPSRSPTCSLSSRSCSSSWTIPTSVGATCAPCAP